MMKSLTKGITPFLFVASLVLLFLIGIVWQRIEKLKTEPVEVAPKTNLSTGKLPEVVASKIPKVNSFDHVRGSTDAKVKVILYLDFECRFCGEFYSDVLKVAAEYDKSVATIFRHYPIDDIHPGARKKAESAECVAVLKNNDAFIEYSDRYLSEVSYDTEFNIDVVKNIVESAGVSSGELEKCLNESQTANIVEAQKQGGVAAGIRGTPQGFVVNERGEAWLIPEALPEEQIKALIDEAIK